MKNILLIIAFLTLSISVRAQVMTPELLWSLNRVGVVGLSNDSKDVIFSISKYDVDANTRSSKKYKIPVVGGDAVEIDSYAGIFTDPNISFDGKYRITTKEVKIKPVSGTDFYPELKKSNVYIYDNLNFRHWDTWEDGKYSHIVLKSLADKSELDIMENEPYDCPQKPFGGSED